MKTQNETSSEAQDGQTTDSVFDFLYHDGRRIASMLAQFDPSGYLHSISQGRAATRGRDSEAGVNSSGGLPGIGKVGSDTSETIHRAHSEEIQRDYDPMWVNALTLMDSLDERGLIQRDVEAARIGQLVLITGELSIYDLQILTGMWELSSVQELIKAGLPSVPEQKKNVKQTPEMKLAMRLAKEAKNVALKEFNLFRELLPILPHTVQANLLGSPGMRVWSTLDPSGLSLPSSELALKHGTQIPGEWAVLGIMDAFPDEVVSSARKITPDGSEMLAKVYEGLAPALRTLLGRPAEAYGVTPLMIFREVEPGQ